MVGKAATPCRHPGCNELVRDIGGRCARHRLVVSRETNARRATAHQRLYTAKWQSARAGFLRSHPLCVHHEQRGQVVAATVVDHIVPHDGDFAVFWDRSNWQALCKRCHDVKTATTDRNRRRVHAGDFEDDE